MIKFVNRTNEINRISLALQSGESQLIVVYGRRRCGKSTLLRKLMSTHDVYYVADMRETPLQISALAHQINPVIPGFSSLIYPDWEALLVNLNKSLDKKIILCLDEFPYLVRNNPELPSVLQKFIDNHGNANFHIVLCGSSQQMMHSMVLDPASPLYGRSDEIIKINPMHAGSLKEYLGIDSMETIREYGVWGGIPRYWEIRQRNKTFEQAVKYHILNPDGILFEEPERLFLDDMRTSVQAYSILTLIGAGCHRISEIAGRLNKPATQLSRPLGLLTDLGYVKREVPFGEPARSGKKSLYKLSDPFLNFYFTFVVPNKSRIEFGLTDQVWKDVSSHYDQYISEIWEDLCRKASPFLFSPKTQLLPAFRWWGTGLNQQVVEIDVVAESTDKKTILVGEAKWTDKTDVESLASGLRKKIELLPFVKHKKVIPVLFLKNPAGNKTGNIHIINPDRVLGACKER